MPELDDTQPFPAITDDTDDGPEADPYLLTTGDGLKCGDGVPGSGVRRAGGRAFGILPWPGRR